MSAADVQQDGWSFVTTILTVALVALLLYPVLWAALGARVNYRRPMPPSRVRTHHSSVVPRRRDIGGRS